MLMNRHSSALLVIDVQEKLIPAIHESTVLIRNCCWLVSAAGKLNVPIVVSEHFPDKLGNTPSELKAAMPSAQYVAKRYFSAVRESILEKTAIASADQIIICGMEAHVCVFETAMDLKKNGKQVYVVADACGSRKQLDSDLAYARMRMHDIEIVSREMVLFEWLEKAGTDLFREMSKNFLR